MCLLGDDNIGFFRTKPDISNLRKTIATKFNMESKDNQSQLVGTFL